MRTPKKLASHFIKKEDRTTGGMIQEQLRVLQRGSERIDRPKTKNRGTTSRTARGEDQQLSSWGLIVQLGTVSPDQNKQVKVKQACVNM